MKKILQASLLFFLVWITSTSHACTTFLISGKYTSDGKSILFKNRDTKVLDNAIAFFNDGKYPYVALVDCNNEWQTMIWGGYNSVGFAIINSAAYNNNIGDSSKAIDLEGIVMKKALKYCKTLKDFENLLDTLKKPMGVDANFGVIDAYGGAAYYETGNFKYKKFDANDPSIAPNGYLVRTNYSVSGNPNYGHGYCRYNTANEYLEKAVKSKSLNIQDLFDNTSRSLTHSLTGTNLCDKMPKDSTPDIRFFIDYIPRSSTSAAIMIIGASNEKQVSNMVMWSILGFPLTSVAIPIWLAGGRDLPAIASMKSNTHAPICDAALKMRSHCFTKQTREKSHDYINLAAVINQKETGYMQKLKPIENEIFAKANTLIQKFDLSLANETEIQEYYDWLDSYLNKCYFNQFGIRLFPRVIGTPSF